MAAWMSPALVLAATNKAAAIGSALRFKAVIRAWPMAIESISATVAIARAVASRFISVAKAMAAPVAAGSSSAAAKAPPAVSASAASAKAPLVASESWVVAEASALRWPQGQRRQIRPRRLRGLHVGVRGLNQSVTHSVQVYRCGVSQYVPHGSGVRRCCVGLVRRHDRDRIRQGHGSRPQHLLQRPRRSHLVLPT